MRNAKTFQIRKNLTATVSELTVAQCLELFWLIGDFAYPSQFETFLQAHADDLLHKAQELVTLSKDYPFKKLSTDEQQALIGHFADVNKAFFSTEEGAQGAGNAGFGTGDPTGFELYEDMAALVNALVRLGHGAAMSYPVSLMHEIVAELERQGEDDG